MNHLTFDVIDVIDVFEVFDVIDVFHVFDVFDVFSLSKTEFLSTAGPVLGNEQRMVKCLENNIGSLYRII